MARTTGHAVALLSLAGTVVLAACNPIPTSPRPTDVTTVAACPAEDGPGINGAVPCVVDGGKVDGPAPTTIRWVYFAADDQCSLDFVQDHRLISCVTRSDWTGPGGSGEGRLF